MDWRVAVVGMLLKIEGLGQEDSTPSHFDKIIVVCPYMEKDNSPIIPSTDDDHDQLDVQVTPVGLARAPIIRVVR